MTVMTGRERKDIAFAHYFDLAMDFATRSHGHALAMLALVALLSVLPGFFAIPPVDRDEARFAQATKQMLETGDYVDIRFQDQVRYKKPVGIYWMQAAVVKAASAVGVPRAQTRIWLYRIPSLIGAIGAVLLTYWAGLVFVSRRAAILAALMMASCLLLSIEGRIAKTDAMLLATTVAAMGALARVYLPEQRERLQGRAAWLPPAVFWTAIGVGILLKGPVIALFVVLAAGTLIAVDRSAWWLMALKPLPGIIWCLLLVLPWFLAIISRSGESFFAESIGQDLLAKLATGQESHGAPPGYYFLLYWVTFWPAAVLTGFAVPAIWAARREPGAKFLLAWVVPSWIVLEIIVTKLPHYVMPIYPAIAILIAGIVDSRMLAQHRWLVRGSVWWFLLPILLGIGGLVALFGIGRQFGFLVWPMIGGAVVAGLLAWQLFEPERAAHTLLRAVVASILLVMAVFGWIVPALTPVFPSVALANILRASGCADPRAASAGFHEPSLVFLAGTSTRLTDASGAADFLSGGDCRFAFIEARQARNFAQRAEAIGLLISPVAKVDAYNIGSVRAAAIEVFRSGGPP